MQLFQAAIVARHEEDEARVRSLLTEALEFESEAADSVANDYTLEPTRSVLHRSAASIAFQIGDVKAARRYVEAGLKGNPPLEIKQELIALAQQIKTLKGEQTDHRRKAPRGVTPVKEVIDHYTANAPVDIIALAEALGLSVQQVVLDDPQCSGEIRKDVKKGGFAGFSILVNAQHPRVRRRFTVAHEIAHFLLHRDRIGNRLIDDRMYRSKLGQGREADANRLAGNLLMPAKLLTKFHVEGIRNHEVLAAKFDVSVAALKRRLGIRD
jgi:hypothetical protein